MPKTRYNINRRTVRGLNGFRRRTTLVRRPLGPAGHLQGQLRGGHGSRVKTGTTTGYVSGEITGMPNISIRLRAIIDYVTGVLLILLAFAIPYPDQSDEDDWALAGPEHLPHAMKGPSMRAVLIINPVSGDGEPNEEKFPRFRSG